MKFLTIGKFKDTFYTIPQSEQQRIGVSTLEVDIDVKKKMGDKFHFYTVPGNDGMMVIVNEVGSLEELEQIFAGVPIVAAGFFKYESYPLIEQDEKSFAAYLERLKTHE